MVMDRTFESFQEAAHPAGRAPPQLAQSSRLAHRQISLAETLDRVLNKGVLLVGEITLSVADIDLLYLGLNVILTSVDTIERLRQDAMNGRTTHRI